MHDTREITSADQLIPRKTYFLEQGDFVGYGKFCETKPPKKTYEGANVFVPDTQPLACFLNLTRIFNDRYELFEACKKNNVQIYESVE
ncbi:hypothetical protein EJK17_00545 [Lactobacillus xujianguonis]|uniref:Uncharacterized protein n=1 Tax=Lactobacillus xujianguonis TaxID=2495899 RepID=A0A437SYA9_9LACO|nr:hypothetical protein [Lactobacillus xujianguonis]RVU71797.1 hypothetical protein EJK17_00545 [Lactobacillus xujianguonis]